MRMEEYWSVWFSACWAGGQCKLTAPLLTADCSETRSGDGNLGPARALPSALGRNLTSDVQGAKWGQGLSQASLEDAWKCKGTAPHRHLHPSPPLTSEPSRKLSSTWWSSERCDRGTTRPCVAHKSTPHHKNGPSIRQQQAGSQRLDPSGSQSDVCIASSPSPISPLAPPLSIPRSDITRQNMPSQTALRVVMCSSPAKTRSNGHAVFGRPRRRASRQFGRQAVVPNQRRRTR